MRIINLYFDSRDAKLYKEVLARQGEHLASTLVMEIPDELKGHKYIAIFELSDGKPVYSQELIPVGSSITYVLDKGLTSQVGDLKIELQAYEDVDAENKRVIKSAVTRIKIYNALLPVAEVMPEDYVPWYTDVTVKTELATQKALEASTYANNARISAEGVVTQEDARTVAETIRVTGESERVANEIVRIAEEADRQDAESARVILESSRANAEALRVIAEANRKDGVDGKDGINGTNGKDGYTPVKGVDYFDGQNGTNGTNGVDGHTPVKGIDYFDGAKGEQGVQGIQGEKGDSGTDVALTEEVHTHVADKSVHKQSLNCTQTGVNSNAEGSDNVVSTDNAHVEGRYSLGCNGVLYTITNRDDVLKTVTLDKISGLVVDDLLQINVSSTVKPIENVKITAINGLIVTLDTTVSISNWKYAIKKNAVSFPVHAEGNGTIASGSTSHAEGSNTISSGSYSHAEGNQCRATGTSSHAEGSDTVASGSYSHAENRNTEASGSYSHAEGQLSYAVGNISHAEGFGSLATIGNPLKITAFDSVAKTLTLDSTTGLFVNDLVTIRVSNLTYQDIKITAINDLVVTLDTTYTPSASWQYVIKKNTTTCATHAEGNITTALGKYSHTQNNNTIAKGLSQTVIGEFNVEQGSYNSKISTDHAFIVGNGTSDTVRSNAFSVDWSGNVDIPTGAKFRAGGIEIGTGGGGGSSVPIGTVTMWAGSTGNIPSGWKLCNGMVLSVTEYATLFQVIGVAFGGNGSTVFLLPNIPASNGLSYIIKT